MARAAAFLFSLLAAAILLLAVIWAVQRRLMYFPSGTVPAPSALGLTNVEAVQFVTADRLTLSAWFVRPGGASTGTTVIVLPGNAGNRAMRAPLASALAGRGFPTLLVDYRGYGGNPGAPSEAGLAADARAARAYLASRTDVDRAQIVYFGESLGTAVAIRLAIEAPPLALVLRSPFTSFADVGRHHYPLLPVAWLLRDRYASIDRLRSLDVPVLMIAGRNDTIVPAALTERLYAAAREPKKLLMLEGLDHNDEELNWGSAIIDAVTKFVSSVRLPK